MSATNDRPFRVEPLRWSEGMLLSPQHFQQNDIYWHERLGFRTRCLRPYGWGVWDLALKDEDLRQGTVTVLRLDAILPDGLPVQYPACAEDKTLASLPLATHPALRGINGRLRVHLALPKRLRGAASERSDLRRFRPVPGSTAIDENTGGDEIEIDRLRACITLLPEDQLTGAHEQMPLLEIERSGNEFQLTTYHPPLLRANAADFLGANGIMQRIDQLIRELLDRARSQAGDAEGQRLVYALTAALPPLQLMVMSGEIHPFDLYLALAGLLGQVAQIAPSPLAAMMTHPYDHLDCQLGFDQIITVVRGLLRNVRIGYRASAFTRIAPGVFEITLGDDWQLDELYIEPRGGERRALERWMNDAHIGDVSLQPEMIRRRVPGAGRQVARDELRRRLPIAETGVLFSIQGGLQSDEHGKPKPLIRSGGRLRVCGSTDALRPEELQLYFRQPGATGNAYNGGLTTAPAVAAGSVA